MRAWLGHLALLVLAAAPATADIGFPPGFTSEVYVTGQGFDTSGERGVTGIPAAGTIGIRVEAANQIIRLCKSVKTSLQASPRVARPLTISKPSRSSSVLIK